MPINPTLYWNFETLVTTGFEGDTDLLSGLVIGTNALGLEYPAPSVTGKSGNGRLLASYNILSFLSTDWTALLATDQAEPFSFSFWWRPLLEPAASGQRVMGLDFTRATSVPPGSVTSPIGLNLRKGSGAGLFDVLNLGSTVATDVPISFRDWNLICIAYEGGIDPGAVGTASFYVNNVMVGTDETATPNTENAGGKLWLSKDLQGDTGNGSVVCAIDELAVWIGHELTAGDVDDIFNGWVYP